MSEQALAQPAKAILASRRGSIRALARRTKYSEAYLGRVLNGVTKPSQRLARLVSEALGVSVEEAFRLEDLEPAPRHPGDRLIGGKP